MKTYPPEADEDYEGNKGCLLLFIASIATFGAFAIAIIIGYLVNELIKYLS
jgi:hypothetical protein